MRVYARNRPAVVGALLLLGFGIVAAFAPLIAPADPLQIEQTREALFNSRRVGITIAGTDTAGPRRAQPHDLRRPDRLADRARRDRHRGRVGVPLGLIWPGYVGGKLDELVIMRFVDAVMAMPGLILILAVDGARWAQRSRTR